MKVAISEKGKSVITKEKEKMNNQITIEQWLLSSMKQQEYNEKGIPRGNGFISQSLTRALSFPLGLNIKCITYKLINFMKKFQHNYFILGCKSFFEQITEENNQNLFEMG